MKQKSKLCAPRFVKLLRKKGQKRVHFENPIDGIGREREREIERTENRREKTKQPF